MTHVSLPVTYHFPQDVKWIEIDNSLKHKDNLSIVTVTLRVYKQFFTVHKNIFVLRNHTFFVAYLDVCYVQRLRIVEKVDPKLTGCDKTLKMKLLLFCLTWETEPFYMTITKHRITTVCIRWVSCVMFRVWVGYFACCVRVHCHILAIYLLVSNCMLLFLPIFRAIVQLYEL